LEDRRGTGPARLPAQEGLPLERAPVRTEAVDKGLGALRAGRIDVPAVPLGDARDLVVAGEVVTPILDELAALEFQLDQLLRVAGPGPVKVRLDDEDAVESPEAVAHEPHLEVAVHLVGGREAAAHDGPGREEVRGVHADDERPPDAAVQGG